MGDTQDTQPVETLAGEAEQSEANKETDNPAKPTVTLEADTDEPDETVEDTDESGDEEDDSPKPKKVSGSARLKARLAAAEAELNRLRTFVPTRVDGDHIAKAVEAEIGPPPKEDDFPDFLAFERALTAYEVDKRQAERTMRKEAAMAGAREEQQAAALREAHEERVAAARKALPDYDEVVRKTDFSVLPPNVAKMCVESRKSAAIAYYLASNPRAMQELSGMSEVAAARRIGSLEASVRLPKPETSTRAPAPVAKLPGGGAPPAMEAHKARSMEEYAAIRLKQLGYTK